MFKPYKMPVLLFVVVCIRNEAVGRGKKANTCMSPDAPTTLNTHHWMPTTTQPDVLFRSAAIKPKSQ